MTASALKLRQTLVKDCIARSTCLKGVALERFSDFASSWASSSINDYGAGDRKDDNQVLVPRGSYPGLVKHVAVWQDRPLWANSLEISASVIDAELTQSETYPDEFFSGSYGDGYGGIALSRRGSLINGAEKKFPNTFKALRSVAAAERVEGDDDRDDMVGASRLAFFARQKKSSHVELHSDHVNYLLTCHLGLRIPTDGETALFFPRARAVINWKTYKLSNLIQTSFEHAAVNDSPTTDRVILYFDIWHPNLSGPERKALRLFEELRHELHNNEEYNP